MPLKLSLVLIPNPQTFEVCGLGCDIVISVVRLDTCNTSVPTRCHSVGSGEMRIPPLCDRLCLDNMGNHHNSLDRPDKPNNLVQVYGVTLVVNPNISHGIASKSPSQLRLWFEKQKSNSEKRGTSWKNVMCSMMNPNIRQMNSWTWRRRRLKLLRASHWPRNRPTNLECHLVDNIIRFCAHSVGTCQHTAVKLWSLSAKTAVSTIRLSLMLVFYRTRRTRCQSQMVLSRANRPRCNETLDVSPWWSVDHLSPMRR